MKFRRRNFRTAAVKRRTREFALTAIFALFFIAGLGGLAHLKYFRIQSVEVIGNKALAKEVILEQVQKTLEGRRFLLFPKDSLIFVNPNTIAASLASGFKSIENVQVIIENLQKLEVEITERSPRYLWCEHQEAREPCYFVDWRGFIFGKAPQFSGSVYVRIYGILNGQEAIGSNFLDVETFRKVSSFAEKMKIAGYSVSKIIAKESGEFDLVLVDGTKIIFTGEQDLDKVLDNLLLVFSPRDFSERTKTANLEYIDLRFNNKVFFKKGG